MSHSKSHISFFIVLVFFLMSCSQKPDKTNSAKNMLSYDIRNDLKPSRLTIAMWDYSWLHKHYPGGEYEDFELVCDELLERKFNTVRIDAFPLVIGMLEHVEQEITIAGSPLSNWGATDRDRKHKVVDELLDFMQVTKTKGINVILSTWGKGCIEFPNIHENYRERETYWQAWETVLDILNEKDLLSHVLYVDLDQEFPYFSPFKPEIQSLGNIKVSGTFSETLAMEAAGRNSDNMFRLDWNEQQMQFVSDLLKESLMHFQKKYPQLRFTYSFTDYWDEIRAMQIDLFDVLELHIWMTQSSRFHSRSQFSNLTKNRGEHDYSEYMKRINATMEAISPMLRMELHNRLKYAMDWADELAVPVTTSEAWGPWWHMDHDDLEWQWLYDWCEEGMNLSAEYGFWGSTPWNFSHPYWDNWSNVDWYIRVNENFLTK